MSEQADQEKSTIDGTKWPIKIPQRIVVPLTPSERDTLIVRLLETLGEQATETERLRSYTHELTVSMFGSLENRIMEQQRYGEFLARIESQLAALREEADKGRERVTDSLDLVGAEEFTQIKCLLDLTNKRLKELELRDARGKKKQERKRPARKNR